MVNYIPRKQDEIGFECFEAYDGLLFRPTDF